MRGAPPEHTTQLHPYKLGTPSVLSLEPQTHPTSSRSLRAPRNKGRFAPSTHPLPCCSSVARSLRRPPIAPRPSLPPPLTSASIADTTSIYRGLKPSTSTVITAISAQPAGTSPTRFAAGSCGLEPLHLAGRSVRARPPTLPTKHTRRRAGVD